MTTTSAVTAAITPQVQLTAPEQKLGFLNKIKGKCLSGAIGGIFSIPEFTGVFKAGGIGYSRTGQKIAGINWESGIIEFFKSLPKAAQWFIVPAAIGGMVCGLGPIGVTLGSLAGFAIPMGISSLFEKALPHEHELIAQACKEKGINIEQPEGVLA